MTTKIEEQKQALVAATAYYSPEATVKTAVPDPRWEKGGTERFQFEHPAHRGIIGSIEIDSTAEVLEHVRLELVVPPAVAEKVITLLMAEPVEVVESKNPEAVEEEPVVIPPTRDPSPEDLEDMAAEEGAEEQDLPPPVDDIIHLEHIL